MVKTRHELYFQTLGNLPATTSNKFWMLSWFIYRKRNCWKILGKNSWNHIKQTKMNLFPAGFSHMEPLWARAGRLRVRLVAFGTYEIFRNALLCVAFTILYSVDRAFSKATLRIYQKTVKLVPTILFFCQLFSRGKPSWLLWAYCNVCIGQLRLQSSKLNQSSQLR